MEGLTQRYSGIEDGGSECCIRIPSPGRRPSRRTGWLCELSRSEKLLERTANSTARTTAVPSVSRAARCRSSRSSKLFFPVRSRLLCIVIILYHARHITLGFRKFLSLSTLLLAPLDQPHCLKSNRLDTTPVCRSHNLQPQRHAALRQDSIVLLWQLQCLSAITISRTTICSVWPERAATWTTTTAFAPRVASSAAVTLYTTAYSCPIWRTLIPLSSRAGRV